MSDLVAFLNARLDEDEGIALHAKPVAEREHTVAFYVHHPGADIDMTGAGHLDRHDPARVLREVEAKRKILAEHTFGFQPDLHDGGTCRQWPCPTVRALAAVWSDHPDYDPEWSDGE